MNGHSRRDPDTISRLPDTTTQDLSVFIGFRYLGPCYGMNGHSRRDPDVISRLPDTTTHFPSVFTGFRCSNRVKMGVLDENIGHIRFFIENLEKQIEI